MDALDGKRLQNLDEVLRQMNKTLATMETTLKDVGVAMTNAFGSATQQMVKNVQQAFRGAQLADMLGIDQAKLGISDLQKEIKLLEGNVDSHTLGTVTWNNKSSKWKYSAGKTKMTDKQEYAAREKLAVLNDKLKYSMMSQEELMRKIVELAGKATQEAEKESLAKQSGLKKSIQLYQQYAQEYLRLTEQMKRETSKDGTLTKRGQVLAAERSQYRQLMHEQAVEIRNARSEGVRLSQEEELKLEVAHRQKLRKIIEQYDKQTDDKKGTKGAQERALQEANTRKAMKEINRLLDDRNMKEDNLAKKGKTEKYYDIQRRKIEEINQKIEEQKRLLGSYGISGERALKQLGGGEKQTDNLKRLIEEGKELEKEKKRLAKVQQEDAAWQEKQRANQAAMFAANGKAIEQQRQLADQIDRLTRKREELVKSKSGPFSSYDSRNYPFVIQIENKIEELKALQAQIERQFQGSMKAGESAFASTKAERDNAEVRKTIAQEEINASKQKAQKAKEAAAIQKKADAESMANQRRQIQIKTQLAAIDKNRITITKLSSDKEKALAAQQQADYKSLQSELSKLIARQKELNTVSRGSGSRAKDRLSTYTISESEKAMRRYADAVRNAQREQKKLGDETNKILPTIQRLASAFGIAFSVRGLAQFGKKLIETRGEFERQQVALRSILQNKQLADEIWDKTMQAALQSPFTAMQLTTYTKQLAAYRIETDKLFETTKRLADVSAGLGVDMQRLILAYGQVKAANYLRASEIRQFTEAGVNVLGELRDYFNDVKGMSVDTAKVMEMVTKRLVTFEDVEAIFKRMTDQGGIFFEMQYVQSQTVRGQIAKLHDAYDQMLNSIGQANEGVLKNMVSLLNNIVKNWQEFKTVIDLIAWPLIILSLHKFALGLIAVDAAAIKASTSMSRLTVAGAKTQLMFKRLFASIAEHPFIALGAAVAAVGVALLNHAKHVRDINKRYEDLMLRTYETQKNLNGLSETIQNNLETMKEAAKGSKAYNEASRENENIVKKLKDQYPELLQGIDLQKDGYEKLIEKIKEYNEELENQIRLEYAARAGFWQDDLTTNIADLQEAQRKREMQFLQNRNLAETEYLKNGKKDNDIWWERIRLAKTWEEQVDIINRQNEAARGGGYSLQSYGFVVPGAGGLFGGSVETNLANLSNNIKQEALVFNDIIRDQLETINEDLGDDIQQFITDNETQVNELFKDKEGAGWKLLNKQITKFFTAKGATDKETREAIQNLLNQYLLIPIKLDWDNANGKSNNQQPIIPPGGKNKENASKLISLIKEMRSEYDKLSKSAYGYAKSEEKVRDAYKQSYEEILKQTGVAANFDFTTNQGEIEALKKVRDYIKGNAKYAKDAWKDVQKTIDQLTAETEIEISVRIREDFGKQMEKAFNDYELTLELDKLNISPEAAKDLFPEFDSQTLGELQDAMQEFYEKQGASFDEEDLKAYKQWSDKIDAEILKSRKEKAKQYSKYLEKEYSERAKVEMQYAKDVAFVTANFNGEQQKNILKGIEDKYQKDINELTWKSFKESAFYVEMMDDLSSVPADYMKIMLDKIEELLAHPETLSPRALKEAINARQKILEAQMDINSISVMRESLKEMRDAATDVGGKTWAQTKKRLDEEQTAQAEKLKGLEEEIRCYEELQGQLKGLEQHDEAVATANRALPEDVISMLENTDIDTLIGQYSDELDSLSVSENAATSAEKDANAEIQARIEYLQRIIPLLVDYRTALNERAAYQATDAGENALFARNGGETSSSVGETINEYKKEADDVSNRLSSLKKWQKAFKNFSDGMAKWNGAVADAITKVGAMGDAFYDTFDALGGETNALTEGWKEFGDTMVQTITQALTLIPQLIAGFIAAGTSINAAMGLIGLIAEAVQLVLVAIGAVAKLHDARYEREIEIQQKKIEDLQRAYDRLEKSIEKAFDTVTYMREYNQEVQNLNEQYEALAKQIDAEKAKKNVDEDKLQDYADKQQEIIDNLEEIKQQQIDTFGGIGEDNYRSAAEGFVDAWKSAFLETGDGLQGLQDHFDEFLNDWFVKQATMRYASAALEPVFKMIDDAVSPNGAGGANVVMQELEAIKEWARVNFPQISDTLEEISRPFIGEGEGSLSGLAAGIQGMTEEQANILEAYWNSVRGYTANIDMNVSRIAQILGAGGDSTNPQLQQLSLIAANTQATHQLLQSVTKSGHPQGGYGIKVFAD